MDGLIYLACLPLQTDGAGLLEAVEEGGGSSAERRLHNFEGQGGRGRGLVGESESDRRLEVPPADH